jgi:histone acetyltransferase (RNA polymerase elongator complex component)
VRIYPTAVLPDTPLYALWQAGKYTPLTNETAAEWCADALEVFLDHDIPVIRIGLNPSEELASAVAAGAYHPAMGELVYSEMWYRKLLRAFQHGAPDRIYVPARELSRAIGHKKCNLLRLREQFPQRDIHICAGSQIETTML